MISFKNYLIEEQRRLRAVSPGDLRSEVKFAIEKGSGTLFPDIDAANLMRHMFSNMRPTGRETGWKKFFVPQQEEKPVSEPKRKLSTKPAIPAIPSEPPIPKTMEDEIRQRGGFQIISTQGKPETPSRYVDLDKFRAAAQERGIPANAVEPLIKHGIVKQK